RIFTWFGHALTVDAENWMAHPGSASAILNIFQHRRTPQHVVILSGDVHYSFVYDVRLRFSPDSPHIWQITSSGIKNAFPPRLLRPFDWLNRWLFATWSPLNVFTRRRHMRIRPRRPSEHAGRYRHQRLVNGSNLGRVMLDPDGVPQVIEVLMPDAGSIHLRKAMNMNGTIRHRKKGMIHPRMFQIFFTDSPPFPRPRRHWIFHAYPQLIHKFQTRYCA
ncbi:MAG TPA: hypothetical protein PLN94_19720, partial [Thiolinea sp.]|nr:hypothetical protein [Thiolinea sp.]